MLCTKRAAVQTWRLCTGPTESIATGTWELIVISWHQLLTQLVPILVCILAVHELARSEEALGMMQDAQPTGMLGAV